MMQEYYTARAAEYDRIYAKPERQQSLRAIEAWLPAKLADKRVLEVACGTGYWTQFIAPSAAEVFAIDAAQETLQIARERVAAAHVTFAIDDAYELRTAPSDFNAAFAGFWFSHVPISQRQSFLAGLNCKLQPRSKIIFLDNRFVPGSSTPIARHDEDGNTFQIRQLSDGTTHEILKNFPSEQELLELAASEGQFPKVTNWEYFWAIEFETN